MSTPPLYVPWTDIERLLDPGPARRQALPGFDTDYVDIVHYIVRCTHRIWEEKNLDLIATHYTDRCPVWTLGGLSAGAEAVTAGTLATLSGFPDRTLHADHVIWSDEGDGTYYSSHRITSHNTHLGDDTWGAATGRRATVVTIADCAVRANRIYEEWLVRDNWSLVVQLGLSPEAIAEDQAARDRPDSALAQWWRSEWQRVHGQRRVPPVFGTNDAADPQSLARSVFDLGWNGRALGSLRELYSPVVELRWPAGRSEFGAGALIGLVGSLLGALPDARVSIDHVAAVPFFDLGQDVAVRWMLAGTHTGHGLHGRPTGLPLSLLGVTHWRVIDGQIVEEWTVFDEIALLRQLRQNVP